MAEASIRLKSEGFLLTEDSKNQPYADEHHIYEIDAGDLSHFPQNKNIGFFQRLFYAEQQEKMIAGGIAPERIKHIKKVQSTGNMEDND